MLVVGAGGLSLQLVDDLIEQGYADECYFYDDQTDQQRFLNFPVIKTEDEVKEMLSETNSYLLGVGGTRIRLSLSEKFDRMGGEMVSFISKKSEISRFVEKIEKGVLVLRNSIIEPKVHVGRGSLLNVNVTLTHESRVGSFCELGPRVTLLGKSEVGDFSFVGAGSIVLPNVKIGKNVVVGAGSVITKDVADNQKVVGIPARPLNA